MTHCDRCGKEMTCSIMSRFNTQQICMPCEKREKAHPDYEVARVAEEASVRRGDMNFKGVGLPRDLR